MLAAIPPAPTTDLHLGPLSATEPDGAPLTDALVPRRTHPPSSADLERHVMSESNPATAEVTYVTAPACHYCEHGRAVLAELAERIPLAVHEVTLGSDEGRSLLATHRFAFPPAVIVDDRLVAHGRLSARRLARLLPLEVG